MQCEFDVICYLCPSWLYVIDREGMATLEGIVIVTSQDILNFEGIGTFEGISIIFGS